MMENIYPLKPIVFVDDEEIFLKSVITFLKINGINNIITFSDPRKLFPFLEKDEPAVIFIDLVMPHISGNEALVKIKEIKPEMPVAVITADNKLEMAVACMKNGAYDYIVKPVDHNRLLTIIRHCIELNELKNENSILRKSFNYNENIINEEIFKEINSVSSKLKSIFKYSECIAVTELPVLITGETGTGKEVLAKIIHRISNRKGEFVALNIAGEEKGMVNDVLFGHVKGGFTGADALRKGLIEKAVDGTLFLDEIGDLTEDIQIKLLRFLQEKKYYPVGSDNEKNTNTRIIFATNKDINTLVKDGKLRLDLYYRLISHHIALPPLRDRLEDIPCLSDYFFKKAADFLKKEIPHIPKELFTMLRNYNFPGNIRELEGMIYDSLSRHEKGILSLKEFNLRIFGESNEEVKIKTDDAEESIKEILENKFITLDDMEEILIKKALEKSGNNQGLAANLLGISRRALNNRLMRKKVFNS